MCHTQSILRLKLTKIPLVPILLLVTMLLFPAFPGQFFFISIVFATLKPCVFSFDCLSYRVAVHLKKYYETALRCAY